MANNTKIVYRSAIDGQFVTRKYARKYPKTTEKEHRPTRNKNRRCSR